ncbi:MAG: ROK family protein [Nanoarchaeota archaeon]|nr:ROK family protein [Nanoarchaeota archaeon]MBU1622739.1 ROK family protein [Nanoarchaeota archaeon]MBU1973828.1 ROK family protein [Nanoarchaeota archaeon]
MAVIGVDVGGTKIKTGIVSNNKIIRMITVKTGTTKEIVINNILSSIATLFNPDIKAIGIGCPGPADYQKGIIGDTPNLQPLKGINLKQIVSDKFKRKVVISNDASCFVLGESIRLKKKNVIGLTLGTGVGGGIVIDGKLYTGNGNAGEFGHCTIKYDGVKGKWGQGEIEAYLSGSAVKKRYRQEPLKLAKKEWQDYGKLLGISIVNLGHTFDPDVIVLGGGIANDFNLFKTSMQQEIKKRAMGPITVIKGSENSSILGAAALVK